MSGITRDFSAAKVEELIRIVKEEVEDSNQFFLFDWFEDTFLTKKMNIHDCLDDMSGYHASVIDKNNIGYDALSKILQRVREVDENYQQRFTAIFLTMNAFAYKMQGIAESLTYSKLSLSPTTYTEALAQLDSIYETARSQTERELEAYARVMASMLDDPDFFDKAFTFLSGVISPLFGFTYNDKGYYYTGEHSIQRVGGFMDWYDEVGSLLGMDLDTEIITFMHDGMEYRLQLWKGSYGWSSAFGGEIGLYYRSESEAIKNPYVPGSHDSQFLWYKCVDADHELPMVLEVYDNDVDSMLLRNRTEDYAKDGDHYWNLAIKTAPGYTKDDLYTKGLITVEDDSLRFAMAEALSANDFIRVEIIGDKIAFEWQK